MHIFNKIQFLSCIILIDLFQIGYINCYSKYHNVKYQIELSLAILKKNNSVQWAITRYYNDH